MTAAALDDPPPLFRGRSIPRRWIMRRITFIRDHFTCMHCGWVPPGGPAAAFAAITADLPIAQEWLTPPRWGRKEPRPQWVSLTIDHIRPLAKGGDDDESNTQTLCSVCNQRKSDEMHTEDNLIWRTGLHRLADEVAERPASA